VAISSASIDHSCGRTGLADLDALRGNLRAALNDSTPTRVKGVLQTMIDTIRVDARDHIEPTFRVPAVRIDYGYMEPTGIEPVTSCLQRRPGTWRVVPVVSRCLILRGIGDTVTFVGGGGFPHLLRPCFVPARPCSVGLCECERAGLSLERRMYP
jgi:hypothetical protein